MTSTAWQDEVALSDPPSILGVIIFCIIVYAIAWAIDNWR